MIGTRTISDTTKITYDLQSKIDQAVFPGLQGGPHNNSIAAIAVAFEQAKTKDFRQYAEQVIKNAQAMANRFQKHGYKVVTGRFCIPFMDSLGPENKI